MLKVLLVDDEPFILQGLKVLLDWEQAGFEILGTAADGEEALQFLQQYTVDVIIADINMPGMTGLELLENIRLKKISSAYFIILSGYAEFTYAQKAIRYDCTYYMLKPVDKEELLSVLERVRTMNKNMVETMSTNQKMEREYLARNLISVISGKYDTINLKYVKDHIKFGKTACYVQIEMDETQHKEEISDSERREYQRKLYDACIEFLKVDSLHAVFDVTGYERVYDIGFIFCDYMAEEKRISRDEYLNILMDYLYSYINEPVIMFVGKTVTNIVNIAKSYLSVRMLNSFQGFQPKKRIMYYEEDIQIHNTGIVLCKNSIDVLVKMIEQNNHSEIIRCVNNFYDEMLKKDIKGKIMNLNINYLLFQLIHLATEQDDEINQEEIVRLISESSFEEGFIRGSKCHISKFACEYADYLTQMRKNVSRGILANVEKEIRKHYYENLTLKELSEKYYVNSAYLGQLFRKKYGQSFKDYLNNFRMEKAATELMRTDKKIYEIADSVGFRDIDYFVNRFIISKGCTPANFWPIVAYGNVWKETGWNAIIYLAAITAIDPCLYEAASIDGAGRWAKIKSITLPGLKPTIIVLLLMNVGNVINAGFEIQYLLGNGLVKSVSQTIDIYVLKWGISQGDYSLGTAAGIFKSLVSIILIVIANELARRNGEERLF